MNKHGLTLIELMVAIVVLGALLGFANQNYQRAIEAQIARTANQDIMLIWSMEKIYKTKHGSHYPGNSQTKNIQQINTDLKINIQPPIGIEYRMIGGSPGGVGQPYCEAIYRGGKWILTNEDTADLSGKVYCKSGPCP